MEEYCVYEHINPTTNQPFYIGMGTLNRPESLSGRSKFWKDTVKKYGYKINIIKRGIDFKEAGNLEIELIKKFGRRDLKTGILVNLNDGGCGFSGGKHTEESKKKISDSTKGKINSKETKEKMSKGHKGMKKPWVTNKYKIDTKLTKEHKLKISKGNKNKTSQYFGIYFHKQSQRWRVKLNGKYYGNFKSEELAYNKLITI
jgi:hypothetical protein